MFRHTSHQLCPRLHVVALSFVLNAIILQLLKYSLCGYFCIFVVFVEILSYFFFYSLFLLIYIIPFFSILFSIRFLSYCILHFIRFYQFPLCIILFYSALLLYPHSDLNPRFCIHDLNQRFCRRANCFRTF